MGTIFEIDNPTDSRLADYRDLTDIVLRRLLEPAGGLFIAEGAKVIRRALQAGYELRSVLLAPRWLESLADVITAADVPVYVAAEPVLHNLTGFAVHRGALASFHRLAARTVAQVLASANQVVVLESLANPTNVGLVARSAAALGMDGMLLDPQCADPLYRRAVKTSMGTVFSLPYARVDPWPSGLGVLRDAGFTVLALTPADGAIDLDRLPPETTRRCALLLGAEGNGLSEGALAAADLAVRIPMVPGIDSLNIGAAAAIAMWELKRRGAADPATKR